jgi:hypothetical protein
MFLIVNCTLAVHIQFFQLRGSFDFFTRSPTENGANIELSVISISFQLKMLILKMLREDAPS